MFKRLKSRFGFTLVEGIATIALLGIVSFALAPLLGNTSNLMALDAAQKKLEADLRYAQSQATTTSDIHGFRVISATQYEVYKNISGVKTVIESPYNHEPMTTSMATDFPNVTFDAAVFPAFVIEFDKTGMPVTGGGTTVTIELSSGESKGISVTSSTGNITSI